MNARSPSARLVVRPADPVVAQYSPHNLYVPPQLEAEPAIQPQVNAQAAHRSLSICSSHEAIWFQLAGIGDVTFQAGEDDRDICLTSGPSFRAHRDKAPMAPALRPAHHR